jgi:periplasmic protein TonB
MKKIFTFLFVSFSTSLFAQQKDSVVTPLSQTDTSIVQNFEIEASFPGGEAAWNQYILKIVEGNIDKITKNKASVGTCEVQFIVDKDGTITNVEALTLKKSLLAKLLIDAVKNGPKWKPALQNGKAVKAWRRQKVTFRAPD